MLDICFISCPTRGPPTHNTAKAMTISISKRLRFRCYYQFFLHRSHHQPPTPTYPYQQSSSRKEGRRASAVSPSITTQDDRICSTVTLSLLPTLHLLCHNCDEMWATWRMHWLNGKEMDTQYIVYHAGSEVGWETHR